MRPALPVMPEPSAHGIHRIVIGRVFLEQGFYLGLGKIEGLLQCIADRFLLLHCARHSSVHWVKRAGTSPAPTITILQGASVWAPTPVSYTHLRAHETGR